MPKFKIEIKINKSIDIVYQAYIDPDNMLRWSTDLEKFEIIKGEFGEIGAIAHLHYRKKGRVNVLEDKLIYLNPGKKIVSQVSGEGLIVHVETHFNAIKEETEIIMSWNGKGKNLMVNGVLIFLRGVIRKRAQSELQKFKELVEKFGVKFK